MNYNLSDDEVQNELETLDDADNLEEIENEPIEANPDDQNDEDKENDDEKEKKAVKPKRTIKNPRFTLNAELLKGPKGLSALEGSFEKVKFKGKGHEQDDLNVLLKTYEYWCHRLYPKFPFQESIEKIEKLGSKGPIQTHLKKIRSGLIDDDLPSSNGALPDFRSDEEEQDAEIETAPSATQTILQDIPIELTEEQLETIRKNREKAEKLRQERLKKIQEKAAMSMPHNVVDNGASSSRIEADIAVNQDDDFSRVQTSTSVAASQVNHSGSESDEEVLEVSKRPARKYFEDSSDEESSSLQIETVREVEAVAEHHLEKSVANEGGNVSNSLDVNEDVTMAVNDVLNEEENRPLESSNLQNEVEVEKEVQPVETINALEEVGRDGVVEHNLEKSVANEEGSVSKSLDVNEDVTMAVNGVLNEEENRPLESSNLQNEVEIEKEVQPVETTNALEELGGDDVVEHNLEKSEANKEGSVSESLDVNEDVTMAINDVVNREENGLCSEENMDVD